MHLILSNVSFSGLKQFIIILICDTISSLNLVWAAIECSLAILNESNPLTNRWNGAIRIKSSVDFWYLRISRNATVPGRQRRVFDFTLLLLLAAFALLFVFVSRILSIRWGCARLRAVCRREVSVLRCDNALLSFCWDDEELEATGRVGRDELDGPGRDEELGAAGRGPEIRFPRAFLPPAVLFLAIFLKLPPRSAIIVDSLD